MCVITPSRKSLFLNSIHVLSHFIHFYFARKSKTIDYFIPLLQSLAPLSASSQELNLAIHVASFFSCSWTVTRGRYLSLRGLYMYSSNRISCKAVVDDEEHHHHPFPKSFKYSKCWLLLLIPDQKECRLYSRSVYCICMVYVCLYLWSRVYNILG